ncbi:MAG: DUF2851 family protein [Verrucomicrobia bacterium]|nr:DUF2851 family protein [Verrucomicrobiota bacterium]
MVVSLLGTNLYAQWRYEHLPFTTLQEVGAAPPERLLQVIWHHQRLKRDAMQTLDGKTLQVLHPGFWNSEPGPDFRNAVIKIGGEIKTGDIELDLTHRGWRDHGHHSNPNFRNVILHVIWSGENLPMPFPVLTLGNILDASLPELAEWLGTEPAQGWPKELSGNCCAPLCALESDKLGDLLRQAALVRFQRKSKEIEFRSRQVGWTQAFWESAFRALGYKHNTWPMQRIAECLPALTSDAPNLLQMQARLLGISGLLPGELPGRSGANSYVQQLWNIWWRERESLAEFSLPKNVWKLAGIRPANHPQRRLALAAHWLSSPDFFHRLENWFATAKPEKELLPSLLKVLQNDKDIFWAKHWTFSSAGFETEQTLIGENRATDLAINVVLPWFWIRSVAGKNQVMQRAAENRYFEWPMAEDNSVLKLARKRLLSGNKNGLLKSAAAQQGLLQIVRDFCEHSNAICENCRFPDLVKQIKQA